MEEGRQQQQYGGSDMQAATARAGGAGAGQMELGPISKGDQWGGVGDDDAKDEAEEEQGAGRGGGGASSSSLRHQAKRKLMTPNSVTSSSPPPPLPSSSPPLPRGYHVVSGGNGARNHHHHRHSSMQSTVETLAGIPHDQVPDMWSLSYIGLYAHCLASGLVAGSIYSASTFCTYVYKGDPNLCANSWNIMTISCNFSFAFGLFSECWRPFGLRRKPFIVAGWLMTLGVLIYLACASASLTAYDYVAVNVGLQTVNLLATVAADGYFIELGQMEASDVRGGIIVTGMMITMGSGIVSAIIQSVLVNGPATNGKDCEVRWDGCWKWGLTLQGYYMLMTVLVGLLTVPMCVLREPYRPDIPLRTLSHFGHDVWKVMRLKPTLYLCLYSFGINLFGILMPYNAVVALTQYVLKMGNFMSGLDSLLSAVASVGALWVFETFMMNLTWRLVNYLSCLLAAVLNVLWVAAFWDWLGLRHPWFAITIDLGQLFTFNINSLLVRFVVVELALPGQEATLFELMSTIQACAYTMNLLLGTMLTTPFGANACSGEEEDQQCQAGQVDLSRFDETNGPRAFTNYTLACMAIAITGTAVFTRFLPDGRVMCHEWKKQGEQGHRGDLYAFMTLFMTLTLLALGVLLTALLLQPGYACEPWLGGSGC